MSQYVSDAHPESNGMWLPLIEYSVKSGLSLSTIRRKIKSNSVQYRLEKGRYLIHFQDTHQDATTFEQRTQEIAPPQAPQMSRYQETVALKPKPVRTDSAHDDTVRLVSDAFEHAIKEKEERIRLLEKRNRDLEDHLNELRLLVQVLEEKYEVRY